MATITAQPFGDTDYDVFADDVYIGQLLGTHPDVEQPHFIMDGWNDEEEPNLWASTGFDLRATWSTVDDALKDIDASINHGYRPERPDNAW